MTRRPKLDKQFNDWLTLLADKAKSDQDAAYLFLFLYSGVPSKTTLSEDIKNELLELIIPRVKIDSDIQIIHFLQKIIRTYNEAGQPLPQALRGFYPEDYIKPKKGRSSLDNLEKYEDISKKIYHYRLNQGLYPIFNWDIMIYGKYYII
jgi:hypothetical protein